MYYVMRASAPSLHRESTDSLIHNVCSIYTNAYYAYNIILIIAIIILA